MTGPAVVTTALARRRATQFVVHAAVRRGRLTAVRHRYGRDGLVRAGLGVLAGTQLALGLWVLLLPELFWKWPWVSQLPPYNEHLLRDFGGAGLALAVVLCAAVATMDRRLVLTALVAYLVSAVPHLVFHARHLAGLPAASGAGFMALLGTAVLLPSVLLWLAVAEGSGKASADAA